MRSFCVAVQQVFSTSYKVPYSVGMPKDPMQNGFLNVSTRSRERPLTVNVGGSMDLLFFLINSYFDVMK